MPPSALSIGGFTLTSNSVDLPSDEGAFPDGRNADLVNRSCTSCHSASMALMQPALTPAQWQAVVLKMRDIYKAPVTIEDVPEIVSYLANLPDQHLARSDRQRGAGGRNRPAS